MNCDLPAWVTWTDVVVVLRRVKTGTFGFSRPAGGCFVGAAIYPTVRFLPIVICLQSIRGLLWRLGAFFLADYLVLAV
jgi:hypothetical protein